LIFYFRDVGKIMVKHADIGTADIIKLRNWKFCRAQFFILEMLAKFMVKHTDIGTADIIKLRTWKFRRAYPGISPPRSF